MLITLKIKDKESLSCVYIKDIRLKLENNQVICFNKDKKLGILECVYGIDEDKFFEGVKYE